jgi:hypothetical protein
MEPPRVRLEESSSYLTEGRPGIERILSLGAETLFLSGIECILSLGIEADTE